jgi:hypothetical protein
LGIKITIGEAREAGCAGISMYCLNHARGCWHRSSMTMMLAIALWGPDKRLDDLPLKCSSCGAREVDVRPDYIKTRTDPKIEALVRAKMEGKMEGR